MRALRSLERKGYLDCLPHPPPGRGATLGDERDGPEREEPAVDPPDKIAELVDLARAAEGAGDIEAAVNRLQKAAMLAESLGDHGLVGELMVEVAQVLMSIGEFRQASRFLDGARTIALERDVGELKGEVYRGFGLLYKARGHAREAAVCFDRALEHLEFSSRHRSVLRVLLDLSEVYLRQGQAPQALNLLRRAENVPAKADPALAVRLHLNLGRLAYVFGDRAAAVREYESAREAATGAERAFDRELAALGLSGLYLEGGQLNLAVERLREALALSIVAFAREPVRGIERARFLAMGQRLLGLDTAVNGSQADRLTRRGIDETVRLYNAHPLVLTGAVQGYGHVTALIESEPVSTGLEEVGAKLEEKLPSANHPNPK